MTAAREIPDFSQLNELGCADELNNRLTKLQGILGALSVGGEKIDPSILSATLWCATDLVSESIDIKQRIVELLPRARR